LSSFAVVVGGVAVRKAEVSLTGGADARHQLVFLALLPVLHSMAAVLEHLLLLVLLRAALVYVSRDCQVRNCTSCNGNWGRAEWTNWHLDILLVLSGTGVIIIQEVVLAKKTRAGIALHGEVVELFAGWLLAVASHVGQLHFVSTACVSQSPEISTNNV
jgi:hypothetical protein